MLKESNVRNEEKLNAVVTLVELGENGRVIVFLLGSHDCFVMVLAHFLNKNKFELEMLMDGSNDSENRWLLESEGHLVSWVVPQVVHSVILPVVEVLLLVVNATEVPVSHET